MTPDDVTAIVLRHLHDLVPGTVDQDLDPNAPLKELGADSLDLVDVASRSMQELGVRIQRSEIGRIRTLADLVGVLHRAWVEAQQPAATP